MAGRSSTVPVELPEGSSQVSICEGEDRSLSKETRKQTMKIHAVTIDTANPQKLATWWSQALGIAVANDFGMIVQLAASPDVPPFQSKTCRHSATASMSISRHPISMARPSGWCSLVRRSWRSSSCRRSATRR
ncbi:hypothetical protein AGR6A_pAt20035 [Agrobacterium sp. NCPPB 925]|nr:hypothetical protein AGR6A_pAt20035 [Agrobacterium sp. NCPPB 925]